VTLVSALNIMLQRGQEFLAEYGLSQSQLAKAIGISAAYSTMAQLLNIIARSQAALSSL